MANTAEYNRNQRDIDRIQLKYILKRTNTLKLYLNVGNTPLCTK